MKERLLFPTIEANGVLVQFTDDIILDKQVFVDVPTDYFGLIFIDQKLEGRINPCNGLNLLKYVGKSYNGSAVKLAFVRKTDLPYIAWGFGNISVKNDKLQESYRVGSNGKFLLKISDAAKLIKTFGTDRNIDTEDISDKVKAIVSAIGKPILSKYFADSTVSAFEINSLADDFRNKMCEALNNEEAIKSCGLTLTVLTVNGIHIDENDLESIRNRINHIAEEETITAEQLESIKREIIDSIRENDNDATTAEIQKLKNEIAKIAKSQETDAVLDEIDNLRVELSEAIKGLADNGNNERIDSLFDDIEDIKSQLAAAKSISPEDYVKQSESRLAELEKKFSDKIDSSLSAIKTILDNNTDEIKQNSVPLYDTAKEEWLKSLKLTTDLQLEKAETDDDFAAVAGLLYSNVESNLINKFGISHKEKDFYMTEDEYETMVDSVLIKGKPIFKDSYRPRYIEFKDLSGTFVEMPLEFRFIKCGLNPQQAIAAAKDWTVMNKFRHRSDENIEKLNAILYERRMSKKEFLKYILESYRKLGLYTRD